MLESGKEIGWRKATGLAAIAGLAARQSLYK
jgi:hypothetical protein